MPNFQLEDINYIVTGSRQKILNVDFKSETGKIRKDVSFFTDNEVGTYEPTPLSASFSFDENENRNKNEYGFVFLNDPTRVIRTLYDAKDIALKSAVAEQIGIRRSENDPKSATERDGQIEIYFPHLRKDPLGFVQLDQYSYGMTDKTVVSPVIKRTDLYERKNEIQTVGDVSSNINASDWNFFLNPYDKYGSGPHDPGQIPNLIPTYLYTPLSNLQIILFNTLSVEHESMLNNPGLSAETLSSIEEMSRGYVSSYYSFLEFFKERGFDYLSNLFKPVYNFENIEHNYIVEMPLVYTSRLVNVDNQYQQALINADTIMGKNVLDDIYDTNTSAVGQFRHIREYQGINTGGKKLFLTYFDDKEYVAPKDTPLSLNYKDYDLSGTTDVGMTLTESNKLRDYQRIECIDAINRFISTTLHKANLFAVRIYGLDSVLQDKTKYTAETKTRIKQDIRNSMRRIVSNFVPAHAQYFDVYDSEGRVGIKDGDGYTKQFC